LSEQKIAYYLSFTDVIRILRLIDDAPFRELQLDLEGLQIRVVQDKEQHLPTQPTATKASVSELAHAALPEPVGEQVAAAAVAVTRPEKDGIPVVAPLAGTFYRAPFPGEPPFVEVGAVVSQGDVLGILEIMKLMNHVSAPCAGVISEICAQNEEFVEFGQVLAIINPERAE